MLHVAMSAVADPGSGRGGRKFFVRDFADKAKSSRVSEATNNHF